MDNFKSFLTVPKIIFAILGVIIIIELINAVRALTIPVPSFRPPASLSRVTSVPKTAGKISLSAPLAVAVSKTVPVSVMVDTGGHTVSGIDLIIHFDPKILEVIPAGLIKGKIIDEYPLSSSDNKAGLVSISGVSNLRGGFIGQGQFALINFKAKAPGKTPLIIDFRKGSTTDSNLVEAGTSTDILDSTDNLELSIQ